MKGFPDLPPVWFCLAIALIWGFAALFPGLTSAAGWLRPVSWIFFGLGIALILWAAFWFFSRKTTIEPHHTPTKLLVEGPFRFSRNPIYLGLVLLATGSAIGNGNPLGVIPVAGLIYVLHKRFVLPEERGLLNHLGDSAKDYVAKTRRWI